MKKIKSDSWSAASEYIEYLCKLTHFLQASYPCSLEVAKTSIYTKIKKSVQPVGNTEEIVISLLVSRCLHFWKFSYVYSKKYFFLLKSPWHKKTDRKNA